MRIYLFLIQIAIVTGFFFSCQSKNVVYDEPSFPKEKSVTAHLLTDTALISYPYGMCVDDRNIYILSLMEDQWVQAYDKQTGAFVGSGVKRGQGPGEVVVGISFSFDQEEGLFHVFDQSQMKLLSYRFDQDKQTFVFVKDKSFSGDKKVVRKAWPLRDGAYLIDGQLGQDTTGLRRFQIYFGADVSAGYNCFPVSDADKYPAFTMASVSLSPDKQKLAVGTLFGGILEQFRLDGGIEPSSVRYFYPIEAEFIGGVLRPTGETVYGFSSLYATDQLLYGVLVGGKDPNQFNTICTFDWKGQEVAKYQADCLVFALGSCVTEPGRLYAIAFSQEKGFYLVYFDLK